MQRRRGGVRDRGRNSTPTFRGRSRPKTRSCLGAGRPALRRRRLAVVKEFVGVGLDAVEMHRAFLHRAAADVAVVGAILVDHARQSPRGHNDVRGHCTDRTARAWRCASAHNGDLGAIAKRASLPPRPRNAVGRSVNLALSYKNQELTPHKPAPPPSPPRSPTPTRNSAPTPTPPPTPTAGERSRPRRCSPTPLTRPS
jgi:hypothetical protein